MNYVINILKQSLKEAEDAQKWCKECDNDLDVFSIEYKMIVPLKIAIRIIDMVMFNYSLFTVLCNKEKHPGVFNYENDVLEEMESFAKQIGYDSCSDAEIALGGKQRFNEVFNEFKEAV